MTDKPKDNARVYDDPAITEIYSNKLVTTFFDGHNLGLAFGSQRFVPDRMSDAPKGAPPVHINNRVVLSPSAAVELVNALNSMLHVISQNTNIVQFKTPMSTPPKPTSAVN